MLEVGAHYYWYFSDFSWFMRLHTLGTIVRQFAYWSIGSFLHPDESHLPITSILTTRIIAALPLLDVIKTPQGRHNRIWSQIALLGNRLRVSDASSVQEICKQKLSVVMVMVMVYCFMWNDRNRLKQDQRKCVDYNRFIKLPPPKPDVIVAFLSWRCRSVCKRCAFIVLTTQ